MILTCALALLGVEGAPGWAAGSIVSTAPNITETLFAIGAGDRVVAVSDFCRYPAAALDRRRIGGWDNPNFEVITALRADLIVVQGRHEKLREFAIARNLAFEAVDMDSIASIRAGIARLGELTAREAEATSLTFSIDARLDRVRTAVAMIEPADRPRVFLSIGRRRGSLDGLLTVSANSFLGEALEIAGGVNVFGDLNQAYPQISKESLLTARPEIIVELQGNALSPAEAEQLRRDWDRLDALSAVRQGGIRVLAADHLLIPGPRIASTVELLYELLHEEMEVGAKLPGARHSSPSANDDNLN